MHFWPLTEADTKLATDKVAEYLGPVWGSFAKDEMEKYVKMTPLSL